MFALLIKGSCPLALNVWTARAGGRNKITMQIEFRSDCDLPFRRFERVNVSFALADQPEVSNRSCTCAN